MPKNKRNIRRYRPQMKMDNIKTRQLPYAVNVGDMLMINRDTQKVEPLDNDATNQTYLGHLVDCEEIEELRETYTDDEGYTWREYIVYYRVYLS